MEKRVSELEAKTEPKTIYLSEYESPNYFVDTVELLFELYDKKTIVTSKLKCRKNREHSADKSLVLNGVELELLSLKLNGQLLGESDYQCDAEILTLNTPPADFELEVVTCIYPHQNTALEGLYTSGGNFTTQCEAEGFRKITYYPDRPDVMAEFTVTIIADKDKCPVLLSNGNLVASGDKDAGRHFATWHDPFPKPCYLFALVSGDLTYVESSFTTCSGREVVLRVYVREYDLDKCEHAIQSLKRAMQWDEEKYGREYDLDIYMIVAVSDFNMGAMENKGLNIFNSRYVLAKPETATDSDYIGIEAVIGHEYFHNWSGNRVTCRDWFQLSLKEGFTVFRDQQFTGDMTSHAVKRIDDVRLLRGHQFAEDAGPMAHPVRPSSYVEINNFYTMTVYNKGAEVVRMLYTLLGEKDFRQGTDLYFERHDGQAVTTDDFVCALEDANGIELKQFRRWYQQAGTPVVEVSQHYDALNKTFTLDFHQSCPASPGQIEKKPFHIPVAVGFLDSDGNDLSLQLKGEDLTGGVLQLIESEHSFTFDNVAVKPVVSLLRGFSAPVKLKSDHTAEELAFLMANDSDAFNRWEAGQQLAIKVIDTLILSQLENKTLTLDAGLSAAFAKTLGDTRLDKALIAEALSLPGESYIAEFQQVVDPVVIHKVRTFLQCALAEEHYAMLQSVYQANHNPAEYTINANAMGQRCLKNLALAYMMHSGKEEAVSQCRTQFESGNNMTDVMAAFTALVHTENAHTEEALHSFYEKWKHDPLVLDKWFAIQASSPLPGTLSRVKKLACHADFTVKNPNRLRSLVGTFCMRNSAHFHELSGEGYLFLADYVLELDQLNPQIAARLLTPLTHWQRYDAARQGLMRTELERILACKSLSSDVYEIASKSYHAHRD